MILHSQVTSLLERVTEDNFKTLQVQPYLMAQFMGIFLYFAVTGNFATVLGEQLAKDDAI